MKNMQILKI